MQTQKYFGFLRNYLDVWVYWMYVKQCIRCIQNRLGEKQCGFISFEYRLALTNNTEFDAKK